MPGLADVKHIHRTIHNRYICTNDPDCPLETPVEPNERIDQLIEAEYHDGVDRIRANRLPKQGL